MARREVIDCDRCEAKAVPDPVSFRLVLGHSLCPSTGEKDADTRKVDLCSKCAAVLLEIAVSELAEDGRAKWYRVAQTKIKR